MIFCIILAGDSLLTELAHGVSSRQMQQPGAPAPGLPIALIAHFQQGIPSDPLYPGRAAQVQPQPTSSAFFRRMKSKFTWLFMP